MNIAIFTNNYLPNPYGVSMSIESFRKEFEKKGHTVYIFAPKFKGYEDINKNIFRYPSINLNFKKINFPIVFPFSYKISRILKGLDIDIIHSQHPNLLGYQARYWAKKKNIPLVFTWHTLYDKYAHFAKGIIPEKIAVWWVIKNAVKYANKVDQVVVPTISIKKIIQNWGVQNNNIIAIQSGIIQDEFEKVDRQKIRNKYKIADDEILITLVSRLTKEKNVIFLAKAIAKVLEKNKKTTFILAGDGSELENVKNIFNKNGFSDRLKYFGIVDEKIKSEIYYFSDIFVYSSKSETQGMVISEAMYAGLAIVAVDASGVGDLITNNVNGILVEENEDDFANAVLNLCQKKDLRKKIGNNAFITASKNYTSVICAEKMLEMYNKIIGKNEMK